MTPNNSSADANNFAAARSRRGKTPTLDPRCGKTRTSMTYAPRLIFMPRLVLGLATLAAITAQAQTPTQIPYKSPREAYVALSKDPNSKLSRNSDGWQTVHVARGVNEGIWTFAPQSHPTFPSVIKRQPFERGGHLFIGMDVLCGGSKSACDDLVRDFTKLNEQIAKDANDKRKQ